MWQAIAIIGWCVAVYLYAERKSLLKASQDRKLDDGSKKELEQMLKPVREQLEAFGNRVTKSHVSLETQIGVLKDINKNISVDAQNLTKALKGDVKAQGIWGEAILQRILEESGLREGEEYISEGRGLGLKDDANRHQKPDIVINLPDGKHIIVDSKVSLTHYEEFCSAEDDNKPLHLRALLDSIKSHINGLSGKNYSHLEKLDAPDFTLMFMPIEGMYSLALQSDASLHEFAWSKRIVLVGPSTLFATLRTIASIWKIEQQNKNAEEIARQGGALYDKFVGFVEDMQKIDTALKQMQKTYDSAMNKLSEGSGNLIGRVEKLKSLGANPKKSLPKNN